MFYIFVPVAFDVVRVLAALVQANQIVDDAQGLHSFGVYTHLQVFWVY